ncbi:vanadium-dependent haloperoxidase [Blastococcus montanus]|uniref:vanadium-dependent haloperoxidase n=1 Tax=Blastococcus montanus TaxID=3144973 RepID=UPI0032083199
MQHLAAGRAEAAPPVGGVFDIDHGNALFEVIYPPLERVQRLQTPDGSDATLVVDQLLLPELAWFDAIAPYHQTAVGIFSDLGRRPRSEDTIRNKNTAVIYAAYTTLNVTFPHAHAEWRAMVASAGLDPDNREENRTSPAGIGNLAARMVLEARRNDGSNRAGDAGGRTYNRQPYADYTGYRPVNTAYELTDPSRWQPNIISRDGIFTVQQFVTPQYGQVKPITYGRPSDLTLSPPFKSMHHRGPSYRRQVDEVIDASAQMTDRQKMIAELFNDKIFALGIVAGGAAAMAGRMDIEKTIHYVATVEIAIFDAAVASWYFKRKFDSVRPFSAIRHLYGNKKLTAWGGPGKGTVSDIRGSEWRSYLTTADHPEYPSGSAALCLAYAQAARRFLGTDQIDITLPRMKGSSFVEPGVTPANDLVLHWDTWTDMANDCSLSRFWAGVHFRSSIENTAQYATGIGDAAYTFIQNKLGGR